MSEVPGQNLLSQLLGIDNADQPKVKQTQSAKPAAAKIPSPAATQNAMQGVKLSSAFKGLTITSNFMWLVLFAGFFAWLFVVYWIRHNEPLANHVLGPGAAHSATGLHDRVLVDRMRNAMPIRVSQDSGFIYVPGKPNITEQFGHPTTQANASANAYVPPASAVAGPVVNPMAFPAQQQLPLQQPFTYQHPASSPYIPHVPTAAPPASIGYGSAYYVPHKTPDGARVKMIVNR